MSAVEALDELIEQLDGTEVSAAEGDGPKPAADAIDRVLGSTPRTTNVRSLRGDATIEAFRRELVDGLIRVDTAGRALRLLSHVVGAVLAGRA
ncbi:MAG: hypothetical protein DHS20C16_00050 [Phycisphaerae bacterium]|nr:MAG: hypothetical protein DHS20C16_00050 [Phycisphaerae bacterium]